MYMKLLIPKELVCFLVTTIAQLGQLLGVCLKLWCKLVSLQQTIQRVLFLCDSKELVKAFNTRRALDWQDITRFAGLSFFVHNGLLCKMIFALPPPPSPPLLVKPLCDVAKKATQVLVQSSFFVNSSLFVPSP